LHALDQQKVDQTSFNSSVIKSKLPVKVRDLNLLEKNRRRTDVVLRRLPQKVQMARLPKSSNWSFAQKQRGCPTTPSIIGPLVATSLRLRALVLINSRSSIFGTSL
jgi:hypothetical protein